MEFRTVYKPQERSLQLNPENPVTLMGSCFSTNIGEKFAECCWDSLVNPCGTMFNPLSISRNISAALDALPPKVEEINGRWMSWDFSTLFSGATEEECRIKCAEAYTLLKNQLQRCGGTLIVTFGTAFVYYLEHEGRPVANCHKCVPSMFTKWMMSPAEIAALWCPLTERLAGMGVNVIFTLSPVRHVKDGFTQNSLSKAALRLAIAQICATTGAEYFPAYEIVTDDLRDYRFCADDLVHPSSQAVDYVWEIFQKEFMNQNTRTLLKEASALRRRMRHRHLVPDSPEAAEFMRHTIAEAAAFFSSHPYLKA